MTAAVASRQGGALRIAVNVVAFQAAWFACVTAASLGLPGWGGLAAKLGAAGVALTVLAGLLKPKLAGRTATV